MESLRITRLFPVIGVLNDKLRIRMLWIAFAILFAPASVEAGLASMREILMQDELAASTPPRGEQATAYEASSPLSPHSTRGRTNKKGGLSPPFLR